MNTQDILDQVLSLPVEDRAIIADTILRSLNAPDPDVDRKWAAVVARQREELRTGAVKAVALEDVVARIRERH